MSYLIPVAATLCFCLLGCLLCAMCFRKSVHNLLKRSTALRDGLREKEKALQRAREEAVSLNSRIRLLEHQSRNRSEELNEIYRGILDMEKKIARLEKAVEQMLPFQSTPGDPSSISESETTRDTAEVGNAELRIKKLRSVLRLLNSMEK